MWRWIVRIYVSLMVFLVLLFCAVVSMREVSRLLLHFGSPWFLEWLRADVLWAALLAGVMAGQVPVGSSLTGEGWFRSKDGKTFEGFKLEELRPWTWLLISPLFLLGVVAWCFGQSQPGVTSGLTLSSFYHDFLMPSCPDVYARGYLLNTSCNMQLLFVASWMASIGYSLGPVVKMQGTKMLMSLRNKSESAGPVEASQNSSVKEKTEVQ